MNLPCTLVANKKKSFDNGFTVLPGDKIQAELSGIEFDNGMKDVQLTANGKSIGYTDVALENAIKYGTYSIATMD